MIKGRTFYDKKAWLAIILILYLGMGAAAGSSFAFSITPSRGEVVVEAGKEISGEYSIANPTRESIKVEVFADNWIIQKGRDATKWLKVSPKEIVVPPNSARNIAYTVRAPAGVKGEYTTSIVFRSLGATPVGDAIDAVTQVRLAMYVVIKGTEVISGEISKLEVISVSPFKISVKVKNNSNIHIRPKGEITVLKDGEPINVLKLNTSEGPIFSKAEGEIGPKDEMALEPGDYRAAAKVELTPDITISKEVEFSVPEPEDEEGVD